MVRPVVKEKSPHHPMADTRERPYTEGHMSENEEDNIGERRMTLADHLDELRRRLIRAILGLVAGAALGMIFAREVIFLLTRPYYKALESIHQPAEPLTVLTAGGGFDIWMRVALYCGAILAGPWIIYQIWGFVSAGLYPREKRFVQYSIPFSVLLFLGGAAFFVFYVAVPAVVFLVGIDLWLGLRPMITLQSQITFMTDMILAFGLAFQLPLAVLILSKVGIASMSTLNKYRKHVLMAIVIFCAIFAPPDALSMVAMIVPMWMLYEIGVGLSWLLVLRHRKADELDDKPPGAAA